MNKDFAYDNLGRVLSISEYPTDLMFYYPNGLEASTISIYSIDERVMDDTIYANQIYYNLDKARDIIEKKLLFVNREACEQYIKYTLIRESIIKIKKISNDEKRKIELDDFDKNLKSINSPISREDLEFFMENDYEK